MRKNVTALFLIILFSISGFSQVAVYDTVSIYDLQWVPNPDSIAKETIWVGDTVTVRAIVSHGPRELYLGARFGFYVMNDVESPDPWDGYFIIQDDSFEVNTLMGYLMEGDEAYFTGYHTTYYGLSQLNILTNPPTPVTIVSAGNISPGPKLLTLADLATHATGEQWESQNVRVENCVVTNSSYSGGMAVITDGTATGYIDDYFLYFRTMNDNNLHPWPSNGTSINIQGFTRDGGDEYYGINPRTTADIEILSNPPLIEDVERTVGVPTSSDAVVVSANITDNVSVVSATLHYSVDNGDFTEVAMTPARTVYSGTIPAQADGAFVRYFISSVDNEGDFAQMPGDTTNRIYFYHVNDGDMTIYAIQNTMGYDYDGSAYTGYEVTVEGIVTTDTTDWTNNFYMQNGNTEWTGIWVYSDSLHPGICDQIRITGTVQENYGVTRLGQITDMEILQTNVALPDPIVCTTLELSTAGELPEAFESCLIRVNNVTVSDPYPDAPGNFGEIEISDGSGGVRIDDAFTGWNGNLDSTYKLNHTFESVIALGYYSFSNYKLLVRNYDDLIGWHTSNEGDAPVIEKYSLSQNYPNPFNNSTTVRFSIARDVPLSIKVYDILGNEVRNLYHQKAHQGSYELRWDGRDNRGIIVGTGIYFVRMQAGEFVTSRKMLFVK